MDNYIVWGLYILGGLGGVVGLIFVRWVYRIIKAWWNAKRHRDVFGKVYG